MYVSFNASVPVKTWIGVEPLWYIPYQTYSNNRKQPTQKPDVSPLQIRMPQDVFNVITQQHLQFNVSEDNNTEAAGMLQMLKNPIEKYAKRRLRMSNWDFVYLLVYAVPHAAYTKPPPIGSITKLEASHLLENIESPSLVASGSTNLIEYMKPIKERELQNLLESTNYVSNREQDEAEQPHWKDHIDIRIVVDHNKLSLQALEAPHLKRKN